MNITDKVITRLAGEETLVEQERQRKRRESDLRDTVWYYRWNIQADELKAKFGDLPTNGWIMMKIHRALDANGGYNYARIAASSRESLELIIKERGWQK